MKYIKVITLGICLVGLFVVGFVGLANAQTFKAGDTVTVAKDEVIDSMLLAAGSNVEVAGTVNGDVICAGQSITISGLVNGDVICAGQSITISGKVEGNVRLASQSVAISGNIANNATIATQTLTIDKNGAVGRDLLGGSQNTMISGSVSRDVVTGSNSLSINGLVGRNIKGNINSISVGSSGKIYGNVDYTSANDPTISKGGIVGGSVKRIATKDSAQTSTSDLIAAAAGLFVYKLIAILILAIVLILLLPKAFEEASSKAQKAPWHTILIGTAATFLVPILTIILLFTVVGAPLAFLAILIWIIAMILVVPFAGYLLARVLLKNVKKPIWIMAAGVTLLMVLGVIPFIGFFVILVAYLFGMGMVLIEGKKLLNLSRPKKA